MARQAQPETAPFRILTICTGNLYRSPAAEYLLRSALPESQGFEVGSAGNRARPGQPIAAEMASLLSDAGIDASGFRSRPLTPTEISDADLVLALTRAHRSAAVTLVPTALSRCYTLKEFSRLARAVPHDEADDQRSAATRLSRLARAASAFRGPARPEDDDIVDPIGLGPTVTREVFAEIRAAVDDIARTVLDPRLQTKPRTV